MKDQWQVSAKRLFRDRNFTALTLVGGFSMASFFVFIASGPFVYTQAYGLSPTEFSLAFAVNSIGFFAASQLAAGFGERLGTARLVRVAVAGVIIGIIATGCFAAVGFFGFASLPVVITGLFVENALLGLVIPTVMVLALEDQGDTAGLASSLGGTLQMLAGGLMILITAPFFDGTVLPVLSAIALCGLITFVAAGFVRPQALTY